MKKIFALALAALMTASMATVAFAADHAQQVMVGFSPKSSSADADYSDFYLVDSDNVADETKIADMSKLKGGDRIAIPLVVWTDNNDDKDMDSDEAAWYTVNHEYDKNVVARAEWKVGEAETSIEKVKFTDTAKTELDLKAGESNYVYCLVVTLPENNTNKKADVAGTVRVGRTTSAAKDSDGVVSVEATYYADASESSADVELVEGETGIVSFKGLDGEIDIDFEDVATFTVDVDGQGKLNLAWSTDFDKKFGDMYNYANLDFIKFEGEPSFNKNGSLFIYAENKDTFVYEVTEDGAKAVKAEWNADYDAWEIKTRKLTSYVLSDVELDEKTATEESSKPESSKPESGKDNPDTGR